jgi:hypothetical protein
MEGLDLGISRIEFLSDGPAFIAFSRVTHIPADYKPTDEAAYALFNRASNLIRVYKDGAGSDSMERT